MILLKFFLLLILFFIVEKFKTSKIIFRFVIIYIIINLSFIVIKIDFDFNNKTLKELKINKFGNKNLIVLSFDGISDIKMFDEIQQNVKFRENLKDFIFFNDVVSAAPYTSASINAEIIGNLENYYHPEPNFDNLLNDNNLDVSVYESYTRLVSNKNNTVNKGNYKNYSNTYELNKFLQNYFIGSTGRWATALSIPFFNSIFHQQLYKKFIKLISFDSKDQVDPFKKISTPEFIDLFEYDLIFDEIEVDKNLENVVRMYHFTFSHWPVKVNENCDEVRSLKNVKSFDQESILVKCISKKINKFLKLIKKNEIYNNSMIIIKSDHGKTNYVELSYKTNFFQLFKDIQYNNFYETYPYNLKINNSFYWGYGRYKPFLMIKDSNKTNDKIKISEKNVFIHDLSATYCNFFYNEKKCAKYERNNLALDESLYKDHYYDIMIPIYEYSFSNIDHYRKYKISNTKSLLDSLVEKKVNIK